MYMAKRIDFCKRGHLMTETRKYDPSGRSYCSVCKKDYVKELATANPERLALRYRNQKIKQKYGLNPSEFNAMLNSQGNGCAICGEQFESPSHACVDHDHQTSEVRGLLCRKCNSGIGQFNDKLNLLERAVEYLQPKVKLKAI